MVEKSPRRKSGQKSLASQQVPQFFAGWFGPWIGGSADRIILPQL